MHETASFVVKPETSPERLEFYGRLDRVDTAPLWEVLNRLVLPEPKPAIVPALWKYDEVRSRRSSPRSTARKVS
jgi:gentisate 1,2-dioxygenase